MKKYLLLALVAVLLLIPIANAEEQDAGVLPDSPLWGLDKALEQIELMLAAGNIEKAKIELKHASERLSEVKIMIEEKRLDDAEDAEKAHREKIVKVRERIKNIDADDEDAIEDEVELEDEIEQQEDEVDELERAIEIRIK